MQTQNDFKFLLDVDKSDSEEEVPLVEMTD